MERKYSGESYILKALDTPATRREVENDYRATAASSKALNSNSNHLSVDDSVYATLLVTS